ncbi:MAG: hypothetical protein P1P89_18865 [Desulfobacterales bacterium]|nr:hypothetical protein [Desulfobacterales bacterium]
MTRVSLKPITVVFLCVLILSGLGAKAWAQAGQPKISIQINVAKEVRQFKDNKWIVQHVPVASTQRDDILIYTITYTNEGRSPANDAAIVDPIPTGTVYLLDSAQGENAEITCSINGGLLFQSPPAKYVVEKPDGSREEKAAPPEMYTHIKWTIRKLVLPDESGRLRFKVIVQ